MLIVRRVVGSFLMVAKWEASKNWVEVIVAFLCNLSGGLAEAVDIMANLSSIEVITNLLSYLVSFIDGVGLNSAVHFSMGDENIVDFVHLKAE
jgi:hypothetical protein